MPKSQGWFATCRPRRRTVRRMFKRGLTLIMLLAVMLTPIVSNTATSVRAGHPATVRLTALPRRRRARPESCIAASADYSRYSSALQDEVTIESQQLRCREAAERDGQPMSPALEYKDEAVSGTKLERTGLNKFLEDAQAGLFNRAYFYSLSRLARESIIGMAILKRLVNVYKIRVISVTEGLDTNRQGWEIHAQILFMQHERYLSELASNSFGGQATNVAKGYSNGDYCLGYTGEVIPGTGKSRKRNSERKKYVIDPIGSVWVKQIFHWFVEERRAIRWIVRQLNELNAPKDHRSTKKTWYHGQVLKLLQNPKYVGDWPWALKKNNRDPETGDKFQEDRPPEETEKYRRQMPELRLIDDETFMKAQQYLAENRENFAEGRKENGAFVAGREGTGPLGGHLLAGLIYCGHCGRRFHVGGAQGKYLLCPGHAPGVCRCKTQLNRRLAERLILQQISRRILGEEAWFAEVLAMTHAAWSRRQATLPDELRTVEEALAEVERKIARLVDQIENSDQTDPDVNKRLAERRLERRALVERREAAKASDQLQPTEPTEVWVRERLEKLDEALRAGTPAANYALAALVGKIHVTEVEIPGKSRRYYRGVLRLASSTAAAWLDNRPLTSAGTGEAAENVEMTGNAEVVENVEEIVIEFRNVDPRVAESDEAWRLKEAGLFHLEIAERMNVSKLKLTRLLKMAAERRGVPYEDGRTRRKSLERKERETPPYQLKSAEAGRLYDDNLLLEEICEKLDLDRTTLRKAINFYLRGQGRPPMDGRVRRKSLERKNRRRKNDAA
ncbi:MAG: recombinase family protein [Planctomycetales bacterium]|nr:recombinase family protein [Planctomycetales bacterium]